MSRPSGRFGHRRLGLTPASVDELAGAATTQLLDRLGARRARRTGGDLLETELASFVAAVDALVSTGGVETPDEPLLSARRSARSGPARQRALPMAVGASLAAAAAVVGIALTGPGRGPLDTSRTTSATAGAAVSAVPSVDAQIETASLIDHASRLLAVATTARPGLARDDLARLADADLSHVQSLLPLLPRPQRAPLDGQVAVLLDRSHELRSSTGPVVPSGQGKASSTSSGRGRATSGTLPTSGGSHRSGGPSTSQGSQPSGSASSSAAPGSSSRPPAHSAAVPTRG